MVARKNPEDRARGTREYKPKPKEEIPLPEWDGKMRGDPLPKEMRDWTPQTKKWWNTWRKSAQAMLFTDLDWESLLITAVIHDSISSGDLSPTALTNLAGELRQRESLLGATAADRHKMNVSAPNDHERQQRADRQTQKAEDTVQPQNIVDYKSRMEQYIKRR